MPHISPLLPQTDVMGFPEWPGGAEVPGRCWSHRTKDEKVTLPSVLPWLGKLTPASPAPPGQGEQLAGGAGRWSCLQTHLSTFCLTAVI